MDSKKSLYYAIGQFAYAVAAADGVVQEKEKAFIKNLLTEGFQGEKPPAFDTTAIIFKILSDDGPEVETAYDWAKTELSLNKSKLTPEMKNTFISVIEKTAEAFPPVQVEEVELINRLKKDLVEM